MGRQRRQDDEQSCSAVSRGEGVPEGLSIEDPMDALPPVARTILEAARRLLDRGGYEALKLSAIAEEAREPKASIGYYFGSKGGAASVVALVDSLVHEANRALIAETEGLPLGEQRLHALIDGEVRIADDLDTFRSVFELPHALRNERLRPRVAALYEGCRETVLRRVAAEGAPSRPQLLPFAMLMIAIVDGLAIRTVSNRPASTCAPPSSSGSAWPEPTSRRPARCPSAEAGAPPAD